LSASAASAALLDVGLAGLEEGQGGGEDDEVHDEVREAHPDIHVHGRIAQLGRRGATPRRSRRPTDLDLFLDLFARLPEEEIRRDGRAEDRDERRHVRGFEAEGRHDRRAERLEQIRMDDEDVDDVREQREGQPLERIGDEPVAAEHLEDEDANRDGDNEPDGLDVGERVDRIGDRSKVGPDIDRVRAEQEQYRAVEDGSWIVVPEHAGQTLTAHQPEPRADVLDRRHEREGQ